jgi:hypothetical protein
VAESWFWLTLRDASTLLPQTDGGSVTMPLLGIKAHLAPDQAASGLIRITAVRLRL